VVINLTQKLNTSTEVDYDEPPRSPCTADTESETKSEILILNWMKKMKKLLKKTKPKIKNFFQTPTQNFLLSLQTLQILFFQN